MTTKTRQIILHIIACLVFLALPLVFSPESLSLRAYLTNPPTQRDIIFYTLVIAVFYLNFYWLIPRLYFTRRYLLFIAFNLLGLLIAGTIPETLLARYRDPNLPNFANAPPMLPGSDSHPDNHIAPSPDQNFQPPADRPAPPRSGQPPTGFNTHPGQHHHPPRHPFIIDLAQHLFLYAFVLLLALLLRIKLRWDQAEKEKLQAYLSYLKAQVNPHFLFNALNSIYSLSLEGSPQTPASIIKLSEMMRYAFNDAGKERVSLEEELQYIGNYIDLQQTRFGDTVRVEFHADIHPSLAVPPPRIAPLMLIPFIENAFKHGVNAEEDSFIRISLEVKERSLYLEVLNKKVTIHYQGPHSGTGIANTQHRLQLLYPSNHTLTISDTGTEFKVFLSLKLI